MLSEPIIKTENFHKFCIEETVKAKTINEDIMNYKSLQGILTTYGTYPELPRLYIWRYWLSLPNNHELFRFYSKNGIHPYYLDLHDVYPIADQKYLRKLQVMCSWITYWSPHIGYVYFLPNIVYPFIKSLNGDDIFTFETWIALFNSVFRYWFESYPGMPWVHINHCSWILFKESGNELIDVFKKLGISQQTIIWELLKNIFSDSLDKNDWLSLIDFLITYSHKPELILYFTAAFILSSRTDIWVSKTSLNKIKKVWFDIVRNRKIKAIIKMTLKWYTKYSKYQTEVYKAYVPFPDNEYPKINKFPLDFLKATEQVKKDLSTGRWDLPVMIPYFDGNKKSLENAYNQLISREREIKRNYQYMIQSQKDKTESLKNEWKEITVEKKRLVEDMKKIKE